MRDQPENRVPPKTLYHYTSQAGLIGMLNTKAIWASKIHYLNDSREFALALDIARQELNNRIKVASQADHHHLQVMWDSIFTIEEINTCVCCFSELGDSLSQWRGYGGGKAGFSVGFSQEWFKRSTHLTRLSLSRCVYEPEEQQELIRGTIDTFLETNADADPEYWRRNQGYGISHRPPDTPSLSSYAWRDFPARLARIAPLIKDKSFEDEKEWRLVAENLLVFELDHRPGESMLIPYYNIPIGDDKTFDSIREIIVGPTPHPELSKASVRSLAWTTGLVNNHNNIITRTTNIPFRNW